jgi:hypothetical protein
MSKQDVEQSDKIAEGEDFSLHKLIEQQGVSPVHNLDELSDLWPVDDDPDLLLRHILAERAERRRLHTERGQPG